MLGSTNERSWVSTHWNAIKHNAEQSSFFHEHTLHVHKKASAKTTTGKFTQTRQIPSITLQRHLQVFPESGTYRMLFSVEVWTIQMNYVLNLLGCTFAMIFTSKCRTATYSTAWDHPFGQLSTFDLGTTTNRPLVRAVGALIVCGGWPEIKTTFKRVFKQRGRDVSFTSRVMHLPSTYSYKKLFNILKF